MSRQQLTILVSGMIARVPHQGGATWAVLQYLLGLKKLGHRVYFIEPVGEEALLPPGATFEHSINARYFQNVMAEFGLGEQAALVLSGTSRTVGLTQAELKRIEADLLINISGLLGDETLSGSIPLRVYVDLDPTFTQLWHDVQQIDMGFAGHTHYLTVASALGSIPSCGLAWLSTLQPVVLDAWPVAGSIEHKAFTTVANWRGYGSITHEGVFYGQKAHSLRRLIDLPSRSEEAFKLVLAIHPDETRDLAALARHGWVLLAPERFTASPASYRRFIQGSKAELGIVKSGYVASRCGWFSDRSICYLASGRPVIAQDTGFGDVLPVGEGLFSFESIDDILAAIETINSDYPRQRKAARALAEAYFASDAVLARLLELVGVAP